MLYHLVARWRGGMAADHKYAMAGVRRETTCSCAADLVTIRNVRIPMVSNAIPFATSRPAAKGGNYTRENAQFHWGVTPPGHWAICDVKKDPGCRNDLAESETKRATLMAKAYILGGMKFIQSWLNAVATVKSHGASSHSVPRAAMQKTD